MKTYKNPPRSSWEELIKRPKVDNESMDHFISEVFREVRILGDLAIRNYTNKFDHCEIKELEVIPINKIELENRIDLRLREAMQLAKRNIEKFHLSQVRKINKIETSKGVLCWQESRAIKSVGLYIPGGSAPLFSTVLMLAIPAKLAGCKEIILVTPPNAKGEIADELRYAAQLCGVNRIFRIGGAQAIAALSLGTETVPKVQKIFGPGNQYVTAAKLTAQQLGLAIDMPAGPSELLVLAGKTAYLNSWRQTCSLKPNMVQIAS